MNNGSHLLSTWLCWGLSFFLGCRIQCHKAEPADQADLGFRSTTFPVPTTSWKDTSDFRFLGCALDAEKIRRACPELIPLPWPHHTRPENPAPLSRSIWGGMLDKNLSHLLSPTLGGETAI